MNVTKLLEFNGHVDCIYTATLNLEVSQLYTAGGDGIVAAWDYALGGDGAMLVKVNNSVYSMCLFENKLLLGSSTGNLFLINLASKIEERNIEAHAQGIFDIVYDEINERILTCGFDGVLNVWNNELHLKSSIKLSEKSLRNICLLPEAIAIASSDFTIYILDSTTFEIKHRIKNHTNSVFALAFNPIKKELLSGGRDCYLKVWDIETWRLKQEYVGATLHINHIVFSPDNRYYALSSMDKTLKIFDAATHSPLKFITREKNDGHTSSINKALWLNIDSIISISDDKKAISWFLE